jgi:hypothetical protein
MLMRIVRRKTSSSASCAIQIDHSEPIRYLMPLYSPPHAIATGLSAHTEQPPAAARPNAEISNADLVMLPVIRSVGVCHCRARAHYEK